MDVNAEMDKGLDELDDGELVVEVELEDDDDWEDVEDIEPFPLRGLAAALDEKDRHWLEALVRGQEINVRSLNILCNGPALNYLCELEERLLALGVSHFGSSPEGAARASLRELSALLLSLTVRLDAVCKSLGETLGLEPDEG